MTCDRFRAAVVNSDDVVLDLQGPGELAAHAGRCPDCRRWVDAYVDGAAAWMTARASAGLADAVVARTSGPACDAVRAALASGGEGEDDAVGRSLAAGHLAHCEPCRAFQADLAAVLAGLPGLAELDPGLGFASAVLNRTSRRPPLTWRDRIPAVFQRWMNRPRIAWEVAYVVTLCWLVVFGVPGTGLDWTTARVAAADRLPVRVQVVRTEVSGRVATWRERVANDMAEWVSAIDGRQRSAGAAAASARERIEQWWARVVSLRDVIEASWDALVHWFERAFGTSARETSEPPASPVRSSE